MFLKNLKMRIKQFIEWYNHEKKENSNFFLLYFNPFSNNSDSKIEKRHWFIYLEYVGLVVFYLFIIGNLFYWITSVPRDVIVIDIQSGKIESNTLSSEWYRFYDISQSVFYVNVIDSDAETFQSLSYMHYSIYTKSNTTDTYDFVDILGSNIIDNNRFTIDMGKLTEFSLFTIEPDEITPTSVIYSDKKKKRQIRNGELSFYAKFPKVQGLQTIRIFFITALAAILFQVFLRMIIVDVFTILTLPVSLLLELIHIKIKQQANNFDSTPPKENATLDNQNS